MLDASGWAQSGDRDGVKEALLQREEAELPLFIARSLSDFEALKEQAFDGVLLQRTIPQDVQTRLSVMPLSAEMGARFNLSPDDVCDHVIALFEAWGLGRGAAQGWVAQDVQALAEELARMLSLNEVTLRVEVVQDNACRKFHRDAIRARLICTYTGPGTEYGLLTTSGEPDCINRVQTGHPIILKGKTWPGAAEPFLVHRSPPIEESGATRLVIVINEVLSPDF